MGKFGTFLQGVRKVFGKTDDAATLKKTGNLKWVDELGQTPGYWDDAALVAARTTDEAATARKVADPRATQVAKAKVVADKAKNLPLWGSWKNTLVISGVASIVVTLGYLTWSTVSVIGTLSDAAEKTINNFFGVNCEDGDTECQEKGAKNMLLSGLLVTAGIGGLVVLSLKKDSQEPVAAS